MIYVPELRAALFCGSGPHGLVKKDGHYMDDIWAYDINAHRWVCAYPGANVKTLKLKLDEHGFEVNERGEHVPVAYIGHGYNHLIYVPQLHKLMILHTFDPWWKRAIPQRNEWLGVPPEKHGDAYSQGKLNLRFCDPILFDIATCTFERRFVSGKAPASQDYGVLEYIPARKQAFLFHGGAVWYYDFEANTWTHSGAKRLGLSYDQNGCYDSKRNRLYVMKGKLGFWAFDVNANEWVKIDAEGQPKDLGGSNHGTLTYDPAGDVLLWHRKGGAGILAYDIQKNRWRATAPPPKVNWRHKQLHGFYDPELNAHFYYLAGDGDPKGFMLGYRHKRTEER